MKKLLVILVAAFVLLISQGLREVAAGDDERIPRLAQVVALDECDPVTFNAAVGPAVSFGCGARVLVDRTVAGTGGLCAVRCNPC